MWTFFLFLITLKYLNYLHFYFTQRSWMFFIFEQYDVINIKKNESLCLFTHKRGVIFIWVCSTVSPFSDTEPENSSLKLSNDITITSWNKNPQFQLKSISEDFKTETSNNNVILKSKSRFYRRTEFKRICDLRYSQYCNYVIYISCLYLTRANKIKS